ncbi:unnamed protein product [Lampetra planeri]
MPGTDGSFASVASEPGQGCAFYLVAGPAETLLHCADVAGTSSVPYICNIYNDIQLSEELPESRDSLAGGHCFVVLGYIPEQ